MIPPSIKKNLARLRRRERVLTFVWGFACLASLALFLLLMVGLIDWAIDRQRDTPEFVHVGLFVVQAVVLSAAAFRFLLWPQIRRLPDTTLALWVEDRLPHLGHRLISAVQLNQPNARVEGMSTELIALVTRDAEREAQRHRFARVANHSRLKWSLLLLVASLAIAGLPVLIWPEISLALLQRQALAEVDIPRSVYLESATAWVWPIGDPIEIRYRATGTIHEDMTGQAFVTATGQPTDEYSLKFKGLGTDPKTGEPYWIFGEDVHPSSLDLHYSARLGDGRTRRPSVVRLVPRPIISDNLAWVELPEYCGKRPNGERYEQPQGRGDVIGIPGSRIRILLRIQKPITSAWLELLGTEPNAADKSEDDGTFSEVLRSKIKMEVGADGMTAEARFDLKEGLTGYRMIVIDEFGFANKPQPRRSLRLVPEDPPQVMLLRDSFGDESSGDAGFDVEGLPVILGERIRIPYVCFGPYGLGKAQLLYRLLRKHESGKEPTEEDPWVKLQLPEDPKAGAFDAKTGVFSNKSWKQPVPFHAVPSLNPDAILGRTVGGGRVFLETKGLINSKGLPIQLQSGDQIEYCVEVFAAHREPEGSTPAARSESRVSTVLRADEFYAWLMQVGDEDKRIRVLKVRQEGVFEAK